MTDREFDDATKRHDGSVDYAESHPRSAFTRHQESPVSKEFVWFHVNGVPTLFVRTTSLPPPPTEEELERGYWTRGGPSIVFREPTPEERAEYQRTH